MALAIGPLHESEPKQRKQQTIFEGELQKKGRLNRSYQPRWFVLSKTRKLAYYKDQQESKVFSPVGEIDLTEAKRLSRPKEVAKLGFVIELVTQGRTYSLASSNRKVLDDWYRHLDRLIFGKRLHSDPLFVPKHRKKLYVELSDLKEIRVYDNQSEQRRNLIDRIDLTKVSIVRHGDSGDKNIFPFEIIEPDRTSTLCAFHANHRDDWIDKIGYAVKGGIRMKVLYEGFLWKFENDPFAGSDAARLSDWKKNWYGLDAETLNLYYVPERNKFKQFTSTLFFDKEFYTKAVDTQLQGCLPVAHTVVEECDADDPLFDGSSHHQWIFSIKNVLGNNYFAADTEIGMKEWIVHLNWAIGGKEYHIQNLTPNGVQNVPFDKDDPEDSILIQGDHHGQAAAKPKAGQADFIVEDWDVDDAPEPVVISIDASVAAAAKSGGGRRGGRKSSNNIKFQRPQYADVMVQEALVNQPQQHMFIEEDDYDAYDDDNKESSPPPQAYASYVHHPVPIAAAAAAQAYPQAAHPQQQQFHSSQPAQSRTSDAHVNVSVQSYSTPQAPPPIASAPAPNRLSTQEREFINGWQAIIGAFHNKPNSLYNQAASPCDFDGMYNDHIQQPRVYGGAGATSEMHERCQCVKRVSFIMEYYSMWMGTVIDMNDAAPSSDNDAAPTMGMSHLISILSDYSMTELLNDFYHLKRYHSEDVTDNHQVEPLQLYFDKNHGACPMEQCVSLARNNRSLIKCRMQTILRKWYYIDLKMNKNIINETSEFEEIATQQILDMIHCYIQHGCMFALYDTTSPKELDHVRAIYAKKKQKFHSNRYITKIHTFHHLPYRPVNASTPSGGGGGASTKTGGGYNPLLNGSTPAGNNSSSSSSSPHAHGHVVKRAHNGICNDLAQMYEYTPQSFGVDMEHNQHQRAVKIYGHRFADFKQEMLQHTTCALSMNQFKILCLKADILLSTFETQNLRARRLHALPSTMELDRTIYPKDGHMAASMCQALLVYGNCEELRLEFMATYFKCKDINETDKECRRRHYEAFYHFGKLLYTAIMLFGVDIYDNNGGSSDNANAFSFMVSNHNVNKQKFFYHNVNKPILFTKFNASFHGPTSCTTSKNVAIVHMPVEESDGIVLQLDTNNVSWQHFCLDVSIYGCNPAECEQLMHGGACLGIHNILSVSQQQELDSLSHWTSAVTLLRYIVGDTQNQDDIQQGYKTFEHEVANDHQTYEWLEEFDQNVCALLVKCIEHQVRIYKEGRNIHDASSVSTSQVPLYISLLLHSWCVHKQGIIQLNMNLLRRLPKPLRYQFVYNDYANEEDYTLNWSNVFNLFPNCNKIWKRGLYFNNFLCEQYVNFLCSGNITAPRYQLDGVVFSCQHQDDWKRWVATAKNHSSIIKQMGWLITASPPKQNLQGAIETGRVSFIKRVKPQH